MRKLGGLQPIHIRHLLRTNMEAAKEEIGCNLAFRSCGSGCCLRTEGNERDFSERVFFLLGLVFRDREKRPAKGGLGQRVPAAMTYDIMGGFFKDKAARKEFLHQAWRRNRILRWNQARIWI